MSYVHFPEIIEKLEDYLLTPIRYEDIMPIKEWRNAQIDVLRQKRLLTDEDQERYYHEVIGPQFKERCPKQILFSFLQHGICIGYGGLTNIDWESKRAEVSFLLEHRRAENEDAYRKDFTAYLTLLKKVAFETLGFNRLFTETYDIRPLHLSVLEENLFQYEGRMRQHVVINHQWVDSLIHGCLKEFSNVKE